MWESLMRKFTRWIDPKLEKYRKHQSGVKPKYTPKSLEDFISVIQRTPKSILSSRDRERIAAVMSFDERIVGDLMLPKSKMVFVKDSEMLGPLVLDKLYKSGFTNFPVIDSKEKVKGFINTEALNALEVRKMEKADKYVDKKVNYLHEKDSLSTVVDEIAKNNGYYYLVLDEKNELVGFFTVQMLLDYLIK